MLDLINHSNNKNKTRPYFLSACMWRKEKNKQNIISQRAYGIPVNEYLRSIPLFFLLFMTCPMICYVLENNEKADAIVISPISTIIILHSFFW